MSELSKRIGATTLPSVNLLPKDIADKRTMRTVQFGALLAVVVAVALVAIGYVVALGGTGLANQELNNARSAQSTAVMERDSRVDVYEAYRGQELDEYTLAQIGVGEIDYDQLSTAVLATANMQSSFESVEFTMPTAFGFAGLNPDPVLGGGVGTIMFVAYTDDYDAATELLTRIEAIPGVARAYGAIERFEEEGEDGSTAYWTVDGQAVITDLRLSDRLFPVDGIAGLDPTSVVPDLPGVEPSPAPVPEPEPTAEAEEGGDN